MKFDPNDRKIPVMPKWATYVSGRSPEFKIHTQVGQAKNALNYHHKGVIYEWDESKSEWVEWDRNEPNKECAHCGAEMHRSWSGYGHRLHKHPAKPEYKKPHVCEDCYDRHFGYQSADPIPHDWVGKVERIS